MKIIITGATSGIGRATAVKFASSFKENASLWLIGRRENLLQELAQELEFFACKVVISVLDVRHKKDVDTWSKQVKTQWNSVDLLVNNAGLALGLNTLDEGKLEDWDTMIDTNIKGLLYVSRAISPLMVAQQAGHIINIGSTAGKQVYPSGNVYCATKFAVDAISQSMRIDFLTHNIKVTAVNPGMVDTEFSLVRFGGNPSVVGNMYSGIEVLQAADVADAIHYVATLPPHVCINDLTITCTQQANSTYKHAIVGV